MQKKQNKSGFTLIELLIVIAIIGLLATLAIVSLTGAQKKARDTKRIADAKQYQGAIELYYNQFNHYPQPTAWSSFVGEDTSGTTGGIGKFITQAPGSPKNDTTDFYTYAYNAAGAYASGTGADQYVFMVKLEDLSNNAATLAAGDVTDYTNAGTGTGPTGWNTVGAANFITSVSGATVDKNCAGGYVAGTPPTGTGLYCVSE